jgi:DNA-binding MurR/RpiR family transcriptional regulator
VGKKMTFYQDIINEKFHSFSKGLQIIARQLLDDPDTFAFKSAAQVGETIGVSETTVIRFCHALGYSGYSLFQKDIQEELLKGKSSLGKFQAEKQAVGQEDSFYKQVMLNDALNIRRTAKQIDEEKLEEAVIKLTEATNILVAGVRSSHAVAHWLTFSLDLIRGNIRLYKPDMDDIILRLSEMNDKGVIVVFSFHRYALETLNLAKEAKKQGVFVIGITDSAIAPIREDADLILPVQLSVQSTLDTAPAVFSLVNALIAGVSVKNAEYVEKRVQAFESYHADGFFKT